MKKLNFLMLFIMLFILASCAAAKKADEVVTKPIHSYGRGKGAINSVINAYEDVKDGVKTIKKTF